MPPRNHYDWPAIIELARADDGRWRMRFPNSPLRLAKRIRLRQHPDLRQPDGRLEVMVLNEYRRPGDQPYGDIWVRWVATPTAPKERKAP